MNWYIPSLKVRKEQSGHPCPGCSLIMHWKDMIAWAGDVGSVYLHSACAEILFDNVDQDVIPAENTAAAGEAN